MAFVFCSSSCGGGRVVRWCWVNFQGRPTILITVGQGPIALAVGAGGGGLDSFTLIYPFSSFSLWETARYRLKYCLKGPLNPKQPTNQSSSCFMRHGGMERKSVETNFFIVLPYDAHLALLNVHNFSYRLDRICCYCRVRTQVFS